MRDIYADVIVDITQASADKSYQYIVPQALADVVTPGCAVRVPFGGGGRTVDGYVLSLGTAPKVDRARLKELQMVATDRTNITSRLIRLALWMHATYGGSLNSALKTVLPVREKERTPVQRTLRLAVSREAARGYLEQYRRKHYTAKARLLEALLEKGEMDRGAAMRGLKLSGDTIDHMAAAGLVRVSEAAAPRLPEDLQQEMTDGGEEPTLSEEQAAVRDGIFAEWAGANRPVLLRGVTGSGKTLVYMALIERVLAEGKQVIVLIPEIALSWQTVRRFRRRFGDTVTVLHSRMSKGERYDQYERLSRGAAQLVIGPRSALFTPFDNLGLIVIDEEQEEAYRSEITPRYDAREVAVARADMEGAHVVLGSATPSVDSWYRCEAGTWAAFSLHSRFGAAALPAVHVVDMREELRAGNRSFLSRPLQAAVAARLEKGEQSLLFLNRRGLASFVSCRSCGAVLKCPHCDVSLTFHANGRLVCHYCGYETGGVTRCPHCGSPYISGFRAGTERVQADLQKTFPSARILRMDADTTKKKGDYGRILGAFSRHEADILVGTQMIVKGHDFPDVTLVGALAADLSLFASDYRAAERTFQILVQAVGRAGRRGTPGEAFIQTYHPDHYSIAAAKEQDFDAFYAAESPARAIMQYPPMAELLAIHGAGVDEEQLGRAMDALQRYLRRYEGEGTTLLGPAPEAVGRIKDRFRRVLYVRCGARDRVLHVRRSAEKYIEINAGFRGMQFSYDLNA